MNFEVVDRADEKTILCKVSWDSSDKQHVSAVVRVPAALEQYSAEKNGKDLPKNLRPKAVSLAEDLLREAVDVFNEAGDE